MTVSLVDMQKRARADHWELTLSSQISALNLEKPEREYLFHPTRKWRFDFAYPEYLIAIEIEGGTHTQGRHSRHNGYEADCEKYNTATEQGWKVFRFTSDMVKDGRAVNTIEKVLNASDL